MAQAILAPAILSSRCSCAALPMMKIVVSLCSALVGVLYGATRYWHPSGNESVSEHPSGSESVSEHPCGSEPVFDPSSGSEQPYRRRLMLTYDEMVDRTVRDGPPSSVYSFGSGLSPEFQYGSLQKDRSGSGDLFKDH